MTIVSQIRFDMKTKMKDNQINQNIQYPNVSLIYFVYHSICFMCRIFDNEKQILSKEKMLKKHGVFFI